MVMSEQERRDTQKISQHNCRARALGRLGSLTIEEWSSTVKDFDRKCAYCRSVPYEEMDHFIPLCKGGATERYNCVPACKNCNKAKGQKNPYKDYKSIRLPLEDIIRVNHYLYFGWYASQETPPEIQMVDIS